MNRRQALVSLIAATSIPFYSNISESESIQKLSKNNALKFLISKSESLPVYGRKASDYEYRLWNAVLDFIYDHYSAQRMPVWNKTPEQVDLEKRIVNIVYWVIRGVRKHIDLYPVDPAWIMAQIMAESFFYEFAVSWSFAVGICQWTPFIAKHYGLLTPDRSCLSSKLLQDVEKANELDTYLQLKQERDELISENKELFVNKEKLLEEILTAMVQGKDMAEASKHLQALKQRKVLDKKIQESRNNYREFLKVNYQGKSIFDQKDLSFLLSFDERVSYRKPVFAMIQMMGENLRARSGNILVATAGYNAGLTRTYLGGHIYSNYGRVPSYEETTKYVSRIIANYSEIVKRM